MAAYTFVSVESPPGSGSFHAVGPSTDYNGELRRTLVYEQASAVNIQPIPNAHGFYRSASIEPLIFPVMFTHELDGVVDSETFKANITKWFGLGRNRSGLRLIRVLHPDGVTTLEIPVSVERYQRRQDHILSYTIQLKSPVNYFQETSDTTDVTSGGSATVTNDGDARAPVQLEMSGSSLSGIEYTITDNTGRGLANYPVVLDSGITSLTISTTWVLVDGEPVPFLSTGTNGNDECWVYVNVPANGSVTVTIIYNTGVTNPLADTENMGNIDVANTSNVNIKWDIDSLDALTSAPAGKSLMWYLKPLDMTSGTPEDSSYEATDGTNRVKFTLNSPASGQNANGNGMICTLGVEAFLNDELTALTRVTADLTANERAFVRFQTASSKDWVDAWTSSSNGTVSSDIDIDMAVKLAVGLEYIGASPADGASLEVGGTPVSLDLRAGYYPTITSESVTWMKLNGVITNTTTGQTITFDNFMCPDGTLVINTDNQARNRGLTIPDPGFRIGLPVPSDGVDIMSVEDGDNEFTETINGDLTIKHRDAYEAAV